MIIQRHNPAYRFAQLWYHNMIRFDDVVVLFLSFFGTACFCRHMRKLLLEKLLEVSGGDCPKTKMNVHRN